MAWGPMIKGIDHIAKETAFCFIGNQSHEMFFRMEYHDYIMLFSDRNLHESIGGI